MPTTPTIWKTLFDPDFHPALQPRTYKKVAYYPVDCNKKFKDIEVYPKYLSLRTWRPVVDNNYELTGHSQLCLGDTNPNSRLYYNVNKGFSDTDYNLFSNNCSDSTRRILEQFYNTSANPYLSTTPRDTRDFFEEQSGLKENPQHTIILPLNTIEFKRLANLMIEENSKGQRNPDAYKRRMNNWFKNSWTNRQTDYSNDKTVEPTIVEE